MVWPFTRNDSPRTVDEWCAYLDGLGEKVRIDPEVPFAWCCDGFRPHPESTFWLDRPKTVEGEFEERVGPAVRDGLVRLAKNAAERYPEIAMQIVALLSEE